MHKTIKHSSGEFHCLNCGCIWSAPDEAPATCRPPYREKPPPWVVCTDDQHRREAPTPTRRHNREIAKLRDIISQSK